MLNALLWAVNGNESGRDARFIVHLLEKLILVQLDGSQGGLVFLSEPCQKKKKKRVTVKEMGRRLVFKTRGLHERGRDEMEWEHWVRSKGLQIRSEWIAPSSLPLPPSLLTPVSHCA